jgi:RNA polymerase sigma factor (sigma-70 family)
LTLEQLYKEYKNLVFNLALSYTQNVEDAEEITQDVFLSVYDNLNNFKQEAEVKTWIYRIAINKSLDCIKARHRKKRWGIFNAMRLDDDDTQLHLPNFNHPGILMENQEALQRIFSGINQLPENQKTAIVLLKIEEMSNKEAAPIMKLTPKALESLFYRAKQNLQKILSQSEGL